MKKFNLSLNKKTGIIHIVINYKQLNWLQDIYLLLNVSTLTVVNETEKGYETLTEITKDNFFQKIEEFEKDTRIFSTLFLDGCVEEIKENCETSYLLNEYIRFFIAVEYVEDKVHLLINERKYDNLFEKLKQL